MCPEVRQPDPLAAELLLDSLDERFWPYARIAGTPRAFV